MPTGEVDSSTLLLEKVTPREVLRGVEFEYLIRLTNLTDMALEGVRVEDEFSGNLKLVGGEPSPQLDEAGIASWDVGTLEAGQVLDIRARGVAGEGDMVHTMAQAEFRNLLKSSIAVISPALAVELKLPDTATPNSEIPMEVIVRTPARASPAACRSPPPARRPDDCRRRQVDQDGRARPGAPAKPRR